MTMAEQAANEFHNSKVTISIPAIAKKVGATAEKTLIGKRYTFPDGSVLVTVGRGKSHSIKTH